jgi:hypothetical protein
MRRQPRVRPLDVNAVQLEIAALGLAGLEMNAPDRRDIADDERAEIVGIVRKPESDLGFVGTSRSPLT